MNQAACTNLPSEASRTAKKPKAMLAIVKMDGSTTAPVFLSLAMSMRFFSCISSMVRILLPEGQHGLGAGHLVAGLHQHARAVGQVDGHLRAEVDHADAAALGHVLAFLDVA